MKEFLEQMYFGNTVKEYLVSIGIFILAVLITMIFKKIILKKLREWAKKTETTVDDFLIGVIEKGLVPLLYLGAFYLAIKTLTLQPNVERIIDVAAVIIMTLFIIRMITTFLRYLLNSFIRKKAEAEEDALRKQKQIRGITTIVNFLIWVLGFVFLLDNLGFEISAVIAGLGIGGIAIALAAQAILGDLFSYFVIFFDRPFEIGDFIIVGEKKGNVEYIGIKTTRIRSLSGEQLVFSNTELTNSIIHNYKRMERRRVLFRLGVIYETPGSQLAEIPAIVKGIIEEQPDVAFDRAHFASYGNFSLDFEFVYYVLSSDYNKYMDTQQVINLKIYQEFERRGIVFAYPTQTLYLNKVNENSKE
jgi:small-conductance mechanosensitive channel